MDLRLLKQASSLIKFAYNLQQQRAALNPAYSDYDQVYDHFYKENPNMAADNTAQYIVDNFGADEDQVYNYVESRQLMNECNKALNQNFDQAREEFDQIMWDEYDKATQNYMDGLYNNTVFDTPPKIPTDTISYPAYRGYQDFMKNSIPDLQKGMNQNSNFFKGNGRENLRRFLNEPDTAPTLQQ